MSRQGTRKRFDAAGMARRPDPFLEYHRQEAQFKGQPEVLRRQRDDDPIGL